MTRLMSSCIPAFDIAPGFTREADRLLDGLFAPGVIRFTEQWAPVVDISETKDDVIVKAEVPGIDKDDISVTLEDHVLTLRGEKKEEKEEKGKAFHKVERTYGSFVRSLKLPTLVQEDKVKASYKDGILNITLPKAEEVKPKEISISVD